MKTKTNRLGSLLTLVLTIVALMVGQTAWAVEVENVAYKAYNTATEPDIAELIVPENRRRVTYDGNGNTSGSVPDVVAYEVNTTATVKGNTGNLARTGYAFTGWNTRADGDGTTYKEGDTFIITDDITLYAKWTPTYTITWLDGDGNTLKEEQVAYGETPAYTGNTPTKTATAQYTYTFNDTWSPAIVAVTEAATYTSQFDATVNKYTVTFVDEDGTTVLKAGTDYDYGTDAESIVKPADPTKAPTAEYTYTFAGWSPAITNVTGSATYTATYTQIANPIVVYIDADGNVHNDLTGETETTDDDGVQAIPLTGTETTLGQDGTTLWYVVPGGGISYSGNLTLNGPVNLILKDGTTMTAANIGGSDKLLTIYAQPGQTGQLTVATYNCNIALSQRFVAYNMANESDISASAIVSGTVDDVTTINGKTLRLLDGLCISAPAGVSVTLPGSSQAATADFSMASTPYYIYKGTGTVGLNKTDADMMPDDQSVAWNLSGATLDTYNYIGTNGTLQNTNNHLASFTLGTQDVTVTVGFNLFTMPGGYCGKSTVNDGKNVKWVLTENGTDSNDNATYKLSIAKNETEGQTDYGMASYTTAAPWNEYNTGINLIIVADETAYTAYGPCLSDGDKAKLAPQTITVAKNASGWGTYCHGYPVTYSLADATAYTISGLSADGKSVATAAIDNNVVAPRTPLLLGYTAPDNDEATDDETCTLTAQPTTATTLDNTDAIVHTAGTDNANVIFYGNSSLDYVSPGDASSYIYVGNDLIKSYVLRNGTFVLVDKNTGLNAHRCFLNVDSQTYSAPKMLNIEIGDGTTIIKTTDFTDYTDKTDAWYSLDGRKLDSTPTAKGIYINGGRKVVIK